MTKWCEWLQAGWTADDQTIFDHLWGRAVPGSSPAISAPSILVWNKADLAILHSPFASPAPPQQVPVSSFTAPSSAANNCAPTAAGARDDMLHQQAAPDQSSAYAAQASGPSSSSPSFSSSSSPCASFSSSSSSSSPDGSQPAPPLQPGSTRQSDAHAHGQRCLDLDSQAQQSGPGSAKNTSNSALNASFVTAETGIQATAAAAAAAAAAASTPSSSVEPVHDSNGTPLSASCDAMHSSEEQAGLSVGDRDQAPVGLPSSCATCFAACVETCATTGLGLDALSTALLELTNAPSLASGKFCMRCTATSGDEDSQTVHAVAFVHVTLVPSCCTFLTMPTADEASHCRF